MRPLNPAPIVEAIVEIDCDLPPGFDLDGLAEKAEAIQARLGQYPDFERLETVGWQLGFAEAALRGSALEALWFRSRETPQIAQIRSGGFSFSRLAPYGSLDDYLPEIRRLWGIYQEFCRPLAVRAARLRYINRLNLALTAGKVELGDYLRVVPPQPLDGVDFTAFRRLGHHDQLGRAPALGGRTG
jgi:uncharacterized protein (TIGR04255 family)